MRTELQSDLDALEAGFQEVGEVVSRAIRGAVDALIRVRSEGETGGKSTGFSLVKFFTRHAIVALAAYGMMVRLRVDPVGLLVGVSSLGVAVAVEAVRVLRWRRFL